MNPIGGSHNQSKTDYPMLPNGVTPMIVLLGAVEQLVSDKRCKITRKI